MSLNSDEIVQDIRTEFESMLQYVQESKEKIADEVERSLFKQLLGLGAQLMLLFFLMRAREYTRKFEAGGRGSCDGEAVRTVFTRGSLRGGAAITFLPRRPSRRRCRGFEAEGTRKARDEGLRVAPPLGGVVSPAGESEGG